MQHSKSVGGQGAVPRLKAVILTISVHALLRVAHSARKSGETEVLPFEYLSQKSRAASLRIDLPSSGSSIEDGLVDVVVVYKIDRLSRLLMYFSKFVEVFDRNNGTFVSVTGYAGEHQLLIDQKNCYRVHSIIQEPRPTSAGCCA